MLLHYMFSQLKITSEINYYKSHPDLAYTVFSDFKFRADSVDKFHAAYNAVVSLANSGGCFPPDNEINHIFKQLVGWV